MRRRNFVPSVDRFEGRQLLSTVQLAFHAHTVDIKQADGTPIVTAFTPQPGTLHYLALNGVNFEGTDLSGLDFKYSMFNGTDLSQANLKNVNFFGCTFWQPDFTQSDMRGDNLSNIASWRATYSGANFTGDNLSTWRDYASVDGVQNLLTTQIHDASGNVLATIGGTSLQGVNLSGMDLRGANLCGMDLRETNLINVELTGAILDRANLAGANIAGANLSYCSGIGTIFKDSLHAGNDMEGANLSFSDFSDAYFGNANLSQSIDIDTDFSGADFVNHGSNYAASIDDADLTGSIFIGANITGVSFIGTDTSKAIF